MAFQVLPPTHAYSSSVVSPMCENRSPRQHSRGLWWAGASVGWWESGGGQKTLLAAYSWLLSPISERVAAFCFFSLSQRTTLNIRCHLVMVIWTIQHHPIHEWISAPVPVTVHKSTTWSCGFFILRQMLWIDTLNGNCGIERGGSHCCSYDAVMGRAMENDWLMGKKSSSPKLATDLFLYYLTIIYKEWHLGGGGKLACK